LSGVYSTVTIEPLDYSGVCTDSLFPTSNCLDAGYLIQDEDGTQLYIGSIKGGETLIQTIDNSTAIVKNTLGTVQSSTEIQAEGSEDIMALDADYIIKYYNGTLIESGSIPSNDSKVINVPNPITCSDATVTLNSVEMATIPSGDTDNIKVTQSDGTTEVGAKVGSVFEIADSTVTDSDGTVHNVKAEDSYSCIPYKPLIAQVWADMFDGRVLFDGGTFEDKANFVTNATTDFDEYNDALGVITPNGYKTGILHAFKAFDGSNDLTWVRASDATRYNESGLIEVISSNVPRIDYSNGEAVILSEPEATNLVLQSNNLNTSPWSNYSEVSVVENFTTYKGREVNKLSGVSGFSRAGQYFNTVIGEIYTLSFWCKNIDSVDPRILIFTSPTTIKYFSSDINTSDYSLISLQFTATSTSTLMQLRDIGISQSLLVQDFQLEEGIVRTSTIPTTTTSVTRLADVGTTTPPIGTTKITEYFEGGSTNDIISIPATYQMSEGRLTKIIFE
jgi:hypothetical protein